MTLLPSIQDKIDTIISQSKGELSEEKLNLIKYYLDLNDLIDSYSNNGSQNYIDKKTAKLLNKKEQIQVLHS